MLTLLAIFLNNFKINKALKLKTKISLYKNIIFININFIIIK